MPPLCQHPPIPAASALLTPPFFCVSVVFAGGRSASEGGGSTSSDEVVVVTLMLLTTRSLNLPEEGSPERAGAALQQLRGLTSGEILDAQLLWTPQQQGQYISQDSLQRGFSEIQELRA